MVEKPKTWRFEDIVVGYETESIPCSFSENDIHTFAKLSGDYNPLHTEAAFAQKKGYQSRVVHGMLSASRFSYLVGMVIPGKDCLYISQDIRFHNPVFEDQPYVLKGTVVNKSESTKLLGIKMEIRDAYGVLVVSGVAKVKVI